MMVQIITTFLHYFWNVLFVQYMDLQLIGTAYASSVSMLTNLILITIFSSRVDEIKEAWFFPDRNSFKGLVDYLRMGIPSMMIQCLESWIFSIQTFLTSFISVEAMAAQSIMQNQNLTFFMITLGLSYTSSVLIGREIGAQKIEKARAY